MEEKDQPPPKNEPMVDPRIEKIVVINKTEERDQFNRYK